VLGGDSSSSGRPDAADDLRPSMGDRFPPPPLTPPIPDGAPDGCSDCMWVGVESPVVVAMFLLPPFIGLCYYRLRKRMQKRQEETSTYIRYFHALEVAGGAEAWAAVVGAAGENETETRQREGDGGVRGGGRGGGEGGDGEGGEPIVRRSPLRSIELTAAAGLLGQFGSPPPPGPVPITSAGDDRPYRPLLRLASPPPSSHESIDIIVDSGSGTPQQRPLV